MHRYTLWSLSLFWLLGCGGGPEEERREPAPVAESGTAESGTAGAESPADRPPSPTMASLENLTALLGEPELTVYAVGPEATQPGPIAPGAAVPFEGELRVINEAGGLAELEQAELRFEVWTEDGERIACTSVDDSNPPTIVDEGATIVRGIARCTFPSPGAYEVRLYAAFEAEELMGDFDLERHYAGRTEVTVR